MRNLPTRSLMFLGAMYVALTLGAAAAQAKPPTPLRSVPLSALTASEGGTFDSPVQPFRWALSASPGVIEGAPNADQVLLTGHPPPPLPGLTWTSWPAARPSRPRCCCAAPAAPTWSCRPETDTPRHPGRGPAPGQGLAAGRLHPVDQHRALRERHGVLSRDAGSSLRLDGPTGASR